MSTVDEEKYRLDMGGGHQLVPRPTLCSSTRADKAAIMATPEAA
jgi:hypothetical protein